MNNLRRLDLNLLVTLDVLLAEQNVTKAARRLNFSQPSVSVHLAKLRDIFDDPLLLPGPRGMRPTSRAEELREPLRQVLEALGRVVSPASPFDPAQATNTWHISAFDYGESTIVLPALAGLRAAAPGTRLAVVEVTPSRLPRLAERGDIDLAFHTAEGAPPGLHRRILFSESYVLVGRQGHPALSNRLTLEQFCQLEHVLVSPEGGGFHGVTDRILAEAGMKRNVVLSVPHFLFVREAIRATDLVAMLPSRLVRNADGLQICPAPVEVPSYEMAMLWHERCHRDPAHRWLREFIANSV
ncbi:LysR family transcriptional regulator [Budvicia diplopodorum]|uniref:LysR family transcriptional regulator n=1 Tax=Budvicia diplopodorum TaxID=1119056 RepID=UPI00135C8CBF|nr:LysR family transcriptional regulator [Budvicia diplopodorum]